MKNWNAFVKFTRSQLETGDYDAHIPFLKQLVAVCELPRERALWLGLLYMAYYTEGSMWAAYKTPGVPDRRRMPPLDLPITTQRRNLYGGRIKRHFESLYDIPSLVDWLADAEDWNALTDRVANVYGNGRWAKYTTSELLVYIAGLDIEPDNFEIVNSSGPRKGLEALGLGVSEESATLVLTKLQNQGLQLGYSELESILCDWAGMNKGTFYAGRNIDRQQGRIVDVEQKTGKKLTLLWEVRKQVFPHESLGELNGWLGMDNPRKKVYRDRGLVYLPGENR